MSTHPATDRGAPALKDRYEVRRTIARGGMGEVFEAYDRQLARRVAVKVFRSAAAEDRARFDAEAVTLASLSHAGLVQVYDAGEHDGDAFVVLELVDGPTLSSRLKERGQIPPDEVAELGAKVADALAYVHANGVVHRDVTPSNILCGPDGRPRLADFGIARLIDSARLTAPAAVVGTAAYMAPEQVAGEDVTPAADIYSLGLVLLELLTGYRAFCGTAREVAVARLARRPDVPGHLPARWRRLLRDMTRRAPSERPSAVAVRDRLREMADVPVAASAVDLGPTRVIDAPAGTALLPAVALTAVGERTQPIPVAPLVPAAASSGRQRIPAAVLMSIAAGLVAVLAVIALASGGGSEGTPATAVTAPTEPAPTMAPTAVEATTIAAAPTTSATPAPAEAVDGPGRGAEEGKDKGKGKGKDKEKGKR